MSKIFIYDTSTSQENNSPRYRAEPMSPKGLYVNAQFISDFTRTVDTEKEELVLQPSEKIVFTYPEDMPNIGLYESI